MMLSLEWMGRVLREWKMCFDNSLVFIGANDRRRCLSSKENKASVIMYTLRKAKEMKFCRIHIFLQSGPEVPQTFFFLSKEKDFECCKGVNLSFPNFQKGIKGIRVNLSFTNMDDLYYQKRLHDLYSFLIFFFYLFHSFLSTFMEPKIQILRISRGSWVASIPPNKMIMEKCKSSRIHTTEWSPFNINEMNHIYRI